MPRLSDTMERGTVARWLKAVGDTVVGRRRGGRDRDRQGDHGVPVRPRRRDAARSSSARASRPISARRSRWSARPGEEVPERRRPPPRRRPRRRRPRRTPTSRGRRRGDAGAAAEAEPAPSRGAAAPAPRRRQRTRRRRPAEGEPDRAAQGAERTGSTCATLAGSGCGPDGRIVSVDVERAARAQGPPRATCRRRRRRPARRRPSCRPCRQEDDEVVELSNDAARIARRMGESKATVPHFYLTAEVDMGSALELRKELNAALEPEGRRSRVNDLDRASQRPRAAREPAVPPHRARRHLVYHAHANVGIAVALDDGLIVPVIRGVEPKSAAPGGASSRATSPSARGRAS